MRKTYYLAFVTLALTCGGQNVEFEKANFPGKKDELKEVIRKLDVGSDFYQQGRQEFEEFRKGYVATHKYLPVSLYDYQKSGYQFFRNAMSPLNDANRFNPNNASVNYMLGFIWFTIEPTNQATIPLLEKAAALQQEESDIHYWLGWAYHLNGRWDDAIREYETHLAQLSVRQKGNAIPMDDCRKKIAECRLGKTLAASPERVFVDNLGPNINTSFPEYGPSISTDESNIIFTARRPNSIGGKRDETDGGYFEDVYSSTKVNGKWQPSRQISRNVNTEGHDAAAGLSPDGTKLYVYRHSGSDGGDLYESTLFGLDWEQPVHMNRNINTKYHESSVSLSYDEKRLYFVSDKDGSIGDRDIYYSEIDQNGEWGLAKNLGPEINTKYAEEAVFMHPDGVTMYFSSKGHNTMGGYDIFKTTLENGHWQKPVNLGYPINGPDDDVFLVVSGSGNRAYFASSKPGGMGEKDLYKITFLGPEKQPILNSQDQLIAAVTAPVNNLKVEGEIMVESAHLMLLKGVVRDEKTQNPLEATIDLIDNEKGIVLATFKSNSKTGKYLVTLPSGKNYGIAVKAEGYLFHSENFDLPESAEYQEHDLDVNMKKIEVGSTIVLRNIFFDFDKATLRPESESELNRLVKLLKDNAEVRIEIGSHTDDVGSNEYNQKLSEARSKAVVDYLIAKGTNSSRLVSKGYGESAPLESNSTETGRQANRRTEFKILSK